MKANLAVKMLPVIRSNRFLRRVVTVCLKPASGDIDSVDNVATEIIEVLKTYECSYILFETPWHDGVSNEDMVLYIEQLHKKIVPLWYELFRQCRVSIGSSILSWEIRFKNPSLKEFDLYVQAQNRMKEFQTHQADDKENHILVNFLHTFWQAMPDVIFKKSYDVDSVKARLEELFRILEKYGKGGMDCAGIYFVVDSKKDLKVWKKEVYNAINSNTVYCPVSVAITKDHADSPKDIFSKFEKFLLKHRDGKNWGFEFPNFS